VGIGSIPNWPLSPSVPLQGVPYTGRENIINLLLVYGHVNKKFSTTDGADDGIELK